MTCQLEAGIVPIHGQKLGPWAGTLGRIAENLETGSDDMLGWSFLQGNGGVFSVGVRLGEEGQTGVSQLVQGKRGFQTNRSLLRSLRYKWS